MKFNFMFIISIVVFLIASFIISAKQDETPCQIFTFPQNLEKNEFQVTAVLDKTIVFKIRGNPTTGYGWYVNNVKELKDSNICSPLNLNKYDGTYDYITDPHPEGFVGVPGSYYFKFKPLKVGQVNIEFVNKRPWDTHDQKIVKANLSIIDNKVIR